MFRVIIRLMSMGFCFLLGTAVTMTIQHIRFERNPRYVSVGCRTNYVSVHRASDGTVVREMVIEPSIPGITDLDWAEKIEERNRQGFFKIIERWPSQRISGNKRSETFLLAYAEEPNPQFVIIWRDEKGLHGIESKSETGAKEFAFLR